jgi:hypothetical protein
MEFRMFLNGLLGAAVLLVAVPLWSQGAEQCTSAIFSPASTEGGRPMLWKNRDTDNLSNKVVYVKEVPFSYLGVVDADDASGRSVWAGVNTAGFAIINTVAYNLPAARKGELVDLEGVVMADALRTCRTVADFEAYLKANTGPGLGCRTNFGVIDATGQAFIFETHNHGFTKFDAAAVPEKYLVNTNYARSGTQAKGAGYLRFDRASELLRTVPKGPVTVWGILHDVARDISNPLLKQPTIHELKSLPADPPKWITTRDSINKSYTSTCVVLVGKDPKDAASRATMWVIPGEPLTGVAMPFWVDAGGVPDILWKGEDSPLWAEGQRIKKLFRPFPESEKQDYLDVTKLDNKAGTGFLPKLMDAEKRIYERTREFLKSPRTQPELATFQEQAAQEALQVMRAVK